MQISGVRRCTSLKLEENAAELDVPYLSTPAFLLLPHMANVYVLAACLVSCNFALWSTFSEYASRSSGSIISVAPTAEVDSYRMIVLDLVSLFVLWQLPLRVHVGDSVALS
jgi:hypothetical protein